MSRDEELAKAHVNWYMRGFRHQFNCYCDIMEHLLVENFIHGMKHGRELEREETDTNQ